jgi:hypothetical protein
MLMLIQRLLKNQWTQKRSILSSFTTDGRMAYNIDPKRVKHKTAEELTKALADKIEKKRRREEKEKEKEAKAKEGQPNKNKRQKIK